MAPNPPQLPNKMHHILCTGNLCTREQLDDLKSLAPNVHVTRGDFDDDPKLPETRVVTIGSFKIGLVHGHTVVPWGEAEALAALSRELDVDILVSGHTHTSQILEFGDTLYINPGSITGAYSSTKADVIPSFVLMALTDDKVVAFVYELHGADMKVTKSEFYKKGSPSKAAKK